jgi:hypothetical protein
MHRVALLVGTVLVIAALAGCGGGGSTSGGSSTAGNGASSGESAAGGNVEKQAADATDKSFKAKSPTATLTEAEMRGFIQREVDAEMTSQGLSEEEIACVDKNITTMSGEEMAGGVVKPGDAASGSDESAEAYLAGLAEGCL